ncbi:hypothetical protein WME94_49000 [Sorangium sp. So ce429]
MALLIVHDRSASPRSVIAVYAALSILVSVTPTASAQGAMAGAAQVPGGEDEITLKSGGMLRGTLVAEERGLRVIIRIHGTGEEREVPWHEVERVDRAKHVREASPAPPVRPRPAHVVPCETEVTRGPAPPEGVRIHIETAPGAPRVHLYRWSGNTSWLGPDEERVFKIKDIPATGSQTFGAPLAELVCSAPCDKLVDGSRGHEFLLSGWGLTDSDPFQLLDWKGEITLRVEPGNAIARGWGMMMLKHLSWSVSLAGGTAMILNRTIGDKVLDAGPGFRRGVDVVGLGLVGLGAAVLSTGIVLVVSNDTTYEVVTNAPTARPPSRRARSGVVVPSF